MPDLTCPDCGRVKLTVEMMRDGTYWGKCSKWYAIRDEEAEADCRRHKQIAKPNSVTPETSEIGSGVVCHVVVTDPEAHLELIQLCQKWQRGLYIDCEQSLLSYSMEKSCRTK